MQILIIEDEIPAFDKLLSHLNEYLEQGFTYDWARSVTETIRFLEKANAYTLIISDVKLLDGLSFEIFENAQLKIPIIFCSAFDEYLFKAFQTNGIAYILKPYGADEISQAFEKYKTLFRGDESKAIPPKVFQALRTSFDHGSRTYKERFVIKSNKGIHLLMTENISLVVAEGDFCRLIDIDGKTHLYSQNIGTIFSQLDPTLFFRINRSEVVQLNHITLLEKHFKNRLLISLKGVSKPVMTSSSLTSKFRVWIDK